MSHRRVSRPSPQSEGDMRETLLLEMLETDIEREAAVLALRMIQGGRWHGRLIRRGEFRDREVATLFGLDESTFGGLIYVKEFRNALDRQKEALLRSGKEHNPQLTRNVSRLGKLLQLTSVECSVLRMAVLASSVSALADVLELIVKAPNDLLRAVGYAIDADPTAVKGALNEQGTLRRAGFFQHLFSSRSGREALQLDSRLTDELLSPSFKEAQLLQRLVKPAPKSHLTLQDFTHVREAELLQDFLRAAVAGSKPGVNILLYGQPGTGKTQFTRALAESLGAALHEVPNTNGDGECVSGHDRFAAYTLCQMVLARRKRQLLMFDEIEDVFGRSNSGPMVSMFGRGAELRKSWINETLESNPVPAIWVSNEIGSLDPAYMRRFDLIVEFRAPGRVARQRMLDRYFLPGQISDACAQRLLRLPDLAPAQIERAARVVSTLDSDDLARRDTEVLRIIASSMRAMGFSTTPPAPPLPNYFNPTFLNTDMDLHFLANGLKAGRHARICFYGPPGTGKTSFAHFIGEQLDRPVIAKRGSDLLGMYVGETEERIRRAFDQARDEEAILLIDEADGFLRDRASAHRSWEVTQVNELLTQMESFEGIFFASTNLMESLDAAALRRFDFKIRFDFLTRQQRSQLLHETAVDASSALGTCAREPLDGLDNLTPGDFANVLRQISVTGGERTAAKIATLLATEAALKDGGKSRFLGFAPA